MTQKIVIGTTKKGRQKFAKAHEIGILPKITHLAFGNGGHDPATGEPIEFDDNRTTVPGQFSTLYPVTSVAASGLICFIEGRLEYEHEIGRVVSSCGLIDSEEDLVAYKNFSPKTKDGDSKFGIEWTEQF